MFQRIAIAATCALVGAVVSDLYYNSDFHAKIRARRLINDKKASIKK